MDIFQAIRTSDVERIKSLIRDNPSVVHHADMRGFPPLTLAVYVESDSITSLLLAHGANVDGQDGAGNTALMGVCFKGYVSIARILIDFGADIDKQNHSGATALTFAAMFGQIAIAELLLGAGAQKYISDARELRPVDHARMQGNEKLIALLS